MKKILLKYILAAVMVILMSMPLNAYAASQAWQTIKSWTTFWSTQIVYAGNNLYSLSDDQLSIYRYDGVPESWTQVGGPAKNLIGGGTNLYAEYQNDDIYRYSEADQKWERIGGPGVFFVCAGNKLYGLSPDKQGIWRYNDFPDSWTQVGGPAQYLVGGGEDLYAVSPDNNSISRYSDATQTWERIGGPGAQFVYAGNNLYKKSYDTMNVWRYNGFPDSWTEVGGSVNYLVGGGADLYAVYPTYHDIYRYSEAEQNWERVGDMAYQFLAHGNNLYCLSMDRTTVKMTTISPGTTTPTPASQVTMRFYINNPDYYVDNQVQSMDTAPMIKDSRTLLPVRYVAEPLGASVGWDPAEQRVTINMDGKTIDLWINNNMAAVNGTGTPIDPQNPNVTPIIVPPGRTMLPLRFIAENLGCQVDWDPLQQMVTVTYPKPGDIIIPFLPY
jgi:hypothetical protein